MTIPSERTRAIIYARQFMLDLLDPAKTPRVPREVRSRASRVLRHYPSPFDIERAARKCPEILGKYET